MSSRGMMPTLTSLLPDQDSQGSQPSGSHGQHLQILQNSLLLSFKHFYLQLPFPLASLPFLAAFQISSSSPATAAGPPGRSLLLHVAFALSLPNSPRPELPTQRSSSPALPIQPLLVPHLLHSLALFSAARPTCACALLILPPSKA